MSGCRSATGLSSPVIIVGRDGSSAECLRGSLCQASNFDIDVERHHNSLLE